MEWLAAAAGVMQATGLAWWWRGTRAHGTREISPIANVTAVGPVLAVISRAEKVRWNLENPPDTGILLHGVPVNLTEGTLALNLVGGQTVTLPAPASFELMDSGEMRLDAEDVALMKTDGKRPYIIHVPEGAVVDLGAELSVNVGADGSADVWVFKGQAAASRTDASGHTRTDGILNSGDSVRIGNALESSPTKAGDFIRPLATASVDRSPASYRYGMRSRNPGQKLGGVLRKQLPLVTFPEATVSCRSNGMGRRPSPERRVTVSSTQIKQGRPDFRWRKKPFRDWIGLRDSLSNAYSIRRPRTFFSALALDEHEAKNVSDVRPGNVRHPAQRLVIERMRHSGVQRTTLR